jgi:predicted O-methyltransferase YrrM
MRDPKLRRELETIDPILRTYASDVIGMPDEDITKITLEEEREYKNAMLNMAKYRLVAEVTKSQYCNSAVKVGQKIVFDGLLIDAEASDCPLCLGALGPLLRNMLVYYDRCLTNGDFEAPLSPVSCIDPGLDAGETALGNVVFNVRIEPRS